MRVLVLAVALFFLLPVKWSFCSPNDISVHFKEFVVRDGRWGAKFSLKNNTRDHVVTHIDYCGEYKRMSGIHLAIPVFSKGYRPKQGKVAP